MSDKYTVEELRLGEKMINEGCKRCANCCTQQVLNISTDEWNLIAWHRGKNPSKLALECRAVPIPVDNPTLYKMVTYPCPFLVDKLCTIYTLRPQVCRDHPFGVAIVEASQGRTSKINVRCPVVREWAVKVSVMRKLRELNEYSS